MRTLGRGFPMGGRKSESPRVSTLHAVTTCVSVGQYWFQSTQLGWFSKKALIDGVSFNASHAVAISSNRFGRSRAARQKESSARYGRNKRVTPLDSTSRSSPKGFARSSSEIVTRVQPSHKVENVSWKETSKPMGENCNVTWESQVDADTEDCQSNKFSKAFSDICTPLGTPVEPEVWMT